MKGQHPGRSTWSEKQIAAALNVISHARWALKNGNVKDTGGDYTGSDDATALMEAIAAFDAARSPKEESVDVR